MLSLLQSIDKHSRELLTLLKQEKQALGSQDFEQLKQLANNKQTLLDKLQLLDAQRDKKFSSLLQQSHTSEKNTSDENFNSYITSTHNTALINQWAVTQKSIAGCQQQNEINGQILRKQGQLNLEMLSILTGANQQHPAQTYTADGTQPASSSLFNGVKA
ncbi:MAG TPA: flagellar protein FlgN [Gammaproteobacteria bacterium]|nr:flagellar protein FlgN [Gammaproteobacteria bacterium]